MPNTASYVAVEHKLYQTFQMLLFAVCMLDECVARTWLPSLGCVGKAPRSSSSSFVWAGAARTEISCYQKLLWLCSRRESFRRCSGVPGSQPLYRLVSSGQEPDSCWARRAHVLRPEGLFVDIAKLCWKLHRACAYAFMMKLFIFHGFVTFEKLQKLWCFAEKPW